MSVMLNILNLSNANVVGHQKWWESLSLCHFFVKLFFHIDNLNRWRPRDTNVVILFTHNVTSLVRSGNQTSKTGINRTFILDPAITLQKLDLGVFYIVATLGHLGGLGCVLHCVLLSVVPVLGACSVMCYFNQCGGACALEAPGGYGGVARVAGRWWFWGTLCRWLRVTVTWCLQQ